MHQLLKTLSLNPPYAIVGLGITGSSLLRLLEKMDVPAKEICTFDKNDPRAQFKNPQQMISEFQPKTMFVSPGVPLATDWIRNFEAGGGRISSELELAFGFLTKEKTIAITGSIGKSTTTALIGAAIHSFSPQSFVGGNLGTPLADYALALLNKTLPVADYVVLELSSYQLENFKNLSVDVSVLTYLSPNHLERYKGLDDYYQTKLGLLRHTKSFVVVNKDGGDNLTLLSMKTFDDISLFWTSRQSPLIKKYDLDQAQMIGEHNLENLAMAAQVAEIFQWPEGSFQAIKNFAGLPHRLENCGTYNDIQFINDSKATAMDPVLQATLSVISLVSEKNHLRLLLGGRDKGMPWDQLGQLGQNKKIKFTFFGEFAESAKLATKLPGNTHKHLKSALDEVFSEAVAGDLVMLSPGGTSLDEFKGFEDRGNYFKAYLKSYF